MVDLGNLSLGIQIPGLAMLDALDARLAVMDRTQHMVTIGVNTGAVTAAEAQVTSLGTAHQALNKTSTLGMDFSQITAARSAAQGLDGDIVNLGTSLANLAAPAALAAGLGLVTKAASDLNTGFSQLQANTTLTNAQMDQVSASIKGLASTTPTGIQQLSDSFRIATNEGFSTTEAIKVVTAANESSVSTGAKAADVTNALAIAMRDFRIPAEDAGKAMNTLHLAAAEGNTTLEDFASNSAKVWADAGKLGVSFVDAAAALSALTQAGYSAAQSSTMLDGLMQKIIAPTAASRAEIEKLSQATGVDLVTDFTQAGIAARGLPQVLTDIQVATRGNVTEMEKLIPAMRGGRGEIALTSAAGIDFNKQIGDLGDAMSGKTNPTLDAFQRAMGLTSSQVGVFSNQLKLAAADLGQTFVPIMSTALEVLNSFGGAPEKALIDLGLAFAGLKTAMVIGGVVDTAVAALARDTAAMEADTVAVEANVAARKGLAGLLGGVAVGVGAAYGAQQLDQAMISPDVKNLANQQLQDINQAISNGQSTLDEQIAQQEARAATMKKADDSFFGIPNPNIPGVGHLLPTGLTPVDEAQSNGYSDTQIQAQQQVIKVLQDRKAAQDALTTSVQQTQQVDAASPGASMRSPADQYASQLDYSKQATEDAKTAAANQAAYSKQMYTDIATAQKQADADALKARNQGNTDAAKVAKDAAQEAGAAQVAAATASADAWKAANAEVGKVDISQGLLAFANAAPGLDKARDALAAIGKGDGALTGLASISDVFNHVYQDIDKASAALVGYNLTLAETNKAMQQVGSLKSEYLAALDAAEKRAANGTADDSDRQIIAMRSSALSTLDQQTTKLQQSGNQDIIGKLTNLPDYAALDQHLKSIVASNGGGAGIIAKVNLDKTNAAADLDAFEKQDRAAIVQIKADTKDATQAIDTYLQHINALPLDRTVTIHTNIAPQDAPGSTSGAQGNDGVTPSSTPAGWNQFQSLSQPDFTSIVNQGSGGKSSPFTSDPSVYASVLSAAQQYGVDPRALLAFTQMENNDATNISPDLIAAHNYGGQKYVGQAGASQGPMSPEGDNYASFPNADQFFKTLAANLTTGQYAQYYASGDLAQDRRTYVTGGGTGSADQEANIANTVALYQRLSQQFPASNAPYSTDARGGIGAGGNPGYSAADAALTIGNQFANLTPTAANSSTPAILTQAQRAIGEKLDRFGRDVYGRCEEIVDDIVQDATGKDTRFPTADAHVRAAMAGQAGAGHVVSRADARPGDLVGWTGDSSYAGDPAGHIGVYSGNNNYIGTTTNGVHQRPLGPDAVFIRPDGVVAGGPVPGAVLYTGRGSVAPGSPAATQAAASTSPGSVPPNINAGQPGVQVAIASAADPNKALDEMAATFGRLDAASLKSAQSMTTGILPAFQTMQENRIDGDNPANLTPTDKKNAAANAWQQAYQYGAAYAQLLSDTENHTGNLVADTQKIVDIVGGPMADAYGKAALASAQIAASQSEVVKLQAQQKAADDAQQDVVKQRQQADTAASRLQTIKGWGQQYLQERLADKQTSENLAFTQTQRDEQDKQRSLQFSQQVGATDLQNNLADLQKQQQNQVYNRTSAEQLQAATVKGATTNQAAGEAAASLAAMHDQDLAQKDLNTKAIDSIQLQIREQAKQSNLESYNLQTETIAAQRKHEDIMQGYTAEGTAMQRNQQAQQRADTIAQWRLQGTRTAEDAKYQSEKDANALAITAQQKIQTSAQASLDAANQSLTAWQQTGVVVASTAGSAAQAASQNNYAANPAYTRRLGTYATGGTIGVGDEGIVGDAPGGVLTPYSERVRVTPAGVVVTPMANRPASEGGTTINNLNLGDLTLAISDEDRAELTALMQRIVDKSKKAGMNQGRALGIH